MKLNKNEYNYYMWFMHDGLIEDGVVSKYKSSIGIVWLFDN